MGLIVADPRGVEAFIAGWGKIGEKKDVTVFMEDTREHRSITIFNKTFDWDSCILNTREPDDSYSFTYYYFYEIFILKNFYL
jgi:hypothetical protein